MKTLVDEEAECLAGKKHKHNPERLGLRWARRRAASFLGDGKRG